LACVEKITCPKCGGANLQVFEENGEFTGFCFSPRCKKYYENPYGDGPRPPKSARVLRSAEEVALDLEYVKALPGASLGHRKLSPSALEHFGVRMEVSEEDGATPTMAFYPYHRAGELVAYKAKHISPKSIFVMGDFKNVDMFGWQQAMTSGSPKLFITEGEEDAVALFQALKESQKGTQWESLTPAVCSLSAGSSSVKRDLSRVLSYLKSHFREVIFVFDMDEAGRQAVKDGLAVFPSAHSVVLPCKDANECVIEGRTKALTSAVLFKSATPKNTRIINASTLYVSAREQASFGLSWPWPKINDLTRGIRFGETIYIGAGVKMGKSEVVNSIGKHLAIDHDLPILMAKPEEANKKTVKLMLGKVAGKIFHDPKVEMDYEAYDKAAERLGNRLNLINLYQHLGWDSLKDDIRAAASEGCKAVFIDPITNLVNGESAGETDSHLKEISQELSAMMMDLNMVAFIFCHLKAPPSGPTHERGGEIFSSQFAGSRAMMRSCNYMMALWGDKNPDAPIEQRNIRKFIILEDREFGEVGSQTLYWDHNTGLFNPIEDE
jgi:twinkle protein